MAGVAVIAIGACWFTPALAQTTAPTAPAQPTAPPASELAGEIDGGAQYDWLNGGGANAHGAAWNANGSVVVPLRSNWNLQVSGGAAGLDIGSADNTEGYVSASLVTTALRLAQVGPRISINDYEAYQTVNRSHITTWTYGFVGDFYPTPQVTVSAQVGGASGNIRALGVSDSFSGWYAGGEVKGYVTPNIGVLAAVNYDELHSDGDRRHTGIELGADWVLQQSDPFVLSVNYNHDSIDARGAFSVHSDAIGVGAKIFFGGPTGGTLIDRDRANVSDEAKTPPLGDSLLF